MKKILILFTLTFSVSVFAQEYRISESKYRQDTIVQRQGGTLIRLNNKQFNQKNEEGLIETYWKCMEIYVPRWINADSLKKSMSKRIDNGVLVDGITNLYRTKVKVDSTKIHLKNILACIHAEIGTLTTMQKRKVRKELIMYLSKENRKTINVANVVIKKVVK